MKDTMTVFSFCEWFRQSENRKNQFSFDGLKALYDYLINLEDDTGIEMDSTLLNYAVIIQNMKILKSCKIIMVILKILKIYKMKHQ